MSLIKNESGNVYTWFMLCVVVIVMSGVYLVTVQVVDPLSEKYDDLSDQGRITEADAETFNFSINMFLAFPVIVLFGLGIWAVINTIQTKGAQ